MQPYLPHERLDAYQAAVTVARWVRTVKWPAGETALKDQAKRAADSVVLNIAEGSAAQGRNRPKHFGYAKASAAEAAAVLDLVELDGGAEMQATLRRVVAMTHKLR